MRAVVYARISSDRAGEGLAVERQIEACLERVEREGWTLVGEPLRDDAISAWKSGAVRPAYQSVVQLVRDRQVDVVLVWQMSRLWRGRVERATGIDVFREAGVRLAVAKGSDLDFSTAMGRSMAAMLGEADTLESDVKSERLKEQKAQAAARGSYRGGPRPYGFEPDGVTVRECEAEKLRQAAEGVLAGRGLATLARELGMTRATGKPMDGVELRRLLVRPRNAGLIEIGGQIAGEAAWPAIIDRDTWASMVAVLQDPSRRTSPGSKPRHLLSGVARCGTCQAFLRVGKCSSGLKVYRCPNRHVSRSKDLLDARIETAVLEILGSDFSDLLPVEDKAGRDADLAQARQLRTDLEGLAEAFGQGAISLSMMTTASKGLQARLEAVEGRLAVQVQGAPLGALAGHTDPVQAYKAAPVDVQRQIVAVLLDITVRPSRKGRPAGWAPGQPYGDPESVTVAPRTARAAA